MKIVVLKETVPGEARVALMPESVKKLVALKASVRLKVAPDWARHAPMMTTDEAGAEVSSDRNALLAVRGRARLNQQTAKRSFATTRNRCRRVGFPAPAG